MIMVAAAKLGIELGQGLKRITRRLCRGSRKGRSAATRAATCGGNHLPLADGLDWRIAHAGTVRSVKLAVIYLLDTRKALLHYQHIGSHHRFTETAKLFLVLLLYCRKKGFIRNFIVLEKR